MILINKITGTRVSVGPSGSDVLLAERRFNHIWKRGQNAGGSYECTASELSSMMSLLRRDFIRRRKQKISFYKKQRGTR